MSICKIIVYLHHQEYSMMASNKRDNIVTAAESLFWKYGMRRVTIEEICRVAHVSKMTFYKYFAGKVELLQYILEQMMERSIQQFVVLIESDLPFDEKVSQMFWLKRSYTQNMTIELMSDLYHPDYHEIMEFLQLHSRRASQLFVDFIVDSQQKGLIRKQISPAFLMAYMAQTSQMMANPELLSLYDSAEELAMEWMDFVFYGLMARN